MKNLPTKFISFAKIGLFFSASALAAQSLHLADFGAFPDDAQDDRIAIENALDALAKTPGASLHFEPGQYDIGMEGGFPEIARYFTIKGAENVRIIGSDTTLMLHQPSPGFIEIDGCHGLEMSGFTIDYKIPPYAALRVESVESAGRSFVASSLAGYPAIDGGLFDLSTNTWGYFLDAKVPGRLASGVANVFRKESIEELPDNRFRITLQSRAATPLQAVEAGMFFCYQIKRPRTSLIFFARSSDLKFTDLTIYGAPAGHFVGVDSEGITLERSRLLVKPGQVKSGNADGVHLQNCRGAIRIVDSVFEGIGDDCINLYSKPFHLMEMRALNEWRLTAAANSDRFAKRPGAGFLRAGDRLVAFDAEDGSYIEGPMIESIDSEGWAILDSAWLEGVPSERWKLLSIFYNGLSKDVLIEGCTFRNSRRFGIFLKASNTIIRNNHFEGLSASAIIISNEPGHFNEGPFSQNVRIEGNTFVENGFDANYVSNNNWRTITVQAIKNGWGNVGDFQIYGGISIVNNVFQSDGASMFLANLRSGTVAGNVFSDNDGKNEERFLLLNNGSLAIAAE